MKIKKIGHCCLVIEVDGKRIMTDPGMFSSSQDEERAIDLVVITHEHQDHLHIDSLERIIANNPNLKIVTNKSVGKLLAAKGISYEVLEHGEKKTILEVTLEGFGETHAEIYRDWNRVQNTGYLIAEKLFYPGDAFTNPKRPVDILALPVAGPWMKISEAITYALDVKPRVAFPVHDAIYTHPSLGHFVPAKILPEEGIAFVSMNPGDEHEF